MSQFENQISSKCVAPMSNTCKVLEITFLVMGHTHTHEMNQKILCMEYFFWRKRKSNRVMCQEKSASCHQIDGIVWLNLRSTTVRNVLSHWIYIKIKREKIQLSVQHKNINFHPFSIHTPPFSAAQTPYSYLC